MLFLDGALRGIGSNLGTGLTLQGGGRMALGQEQGNSTTQSFNSTKSFAGNISQFHLWNKELDKVQKKEYVKLLPL